MAGCAFCYFTELLWYETVSVMLTRKTHFSTLLDLWHKHWQTLQDCLWSKKDHCCIYFHILLIFPQRTQCFHWYIEHQLLVCSCQRNTALSRRALAGNLLTNCGNTECCTDRLQEERLLLCLSAFLRPKHSLHLLLSVCNTITKRHKSQPFVTSLTAHSVGKYATIIWHAASFSSNEVTSMYMNFLAEALGQ